MFNLETAVSAWRAEFKYDRRFSTTDLDEMERHLRDHVEDLVQSGLPASEAFTEALSQMGGVLQSEREFGKVRWTKVRREGRTLDELAAGWAMVVNYVKLGYRNLRRDKVASIINMVGMSIALSVSIVVYLFVSAWNTMDSFHEHGDRLFYAQHVVEAEHGPETWGRMPIPLGPLMEAEIPQVERAVRLRWHGATVAHEGRFFDELVAFVDPTFLDILTFPLESGSPAALRDPGYVILKKEIAEKYFGEANPVGQTLTLTFDRRAKKVVTVGGVAAKFPPNTGLRFDILLNFRVQTELGLVDEDDWAVETSGILVRVADARDIPSVTSQMDRFAERMNAANPDRPVTGFTFENLVDPGPEAPYVRGRISEAAHPAVSIFFVAIALFMLALSCFNYVNISIGSASRRFNEIGMRKAMGGSRSQLIQQFITENVILCLSALVVAALVAGYVLVPIINSHFVLQIGMSPGGDLGLWLFLVTLLFGVAIVAGAYPALYVSSFEAIAIFRRTHSLGRGRWLTRAFMTFQFVLAFTTVIVSVLLVMNSRYLIRQDWGYDPSGKLVIELQEEGQFGPLRDHLVRHPDVLRVSGASDHIGRGSDWVELESPRGGTGRTAVYEVGPGYLETLGLKVVSGRSFDEAHPGDQTTAVVVNQRFVLSQGWSDPIGQTVELEGRSRTVIGVVDDFTFFFLAQPVPTLITVNHDESKGFMVVQVRSGTIENVEQYVAEVWAGLNPDTEVRQFRQEDVFDASRDQYGRLARSFGYLAGLALLIACMGLFGLASQNLAQRMKEFSIRKIVGASVGRLCLSANRGFLTMLGLAATIATAICVIGLTLLLSAVRDIVPVAHMPVTPVPFSIGYGLVFCASFLAVAIQLYRLSRLNPADILRN